MLSAREKVLGNLNREGRKGGSAFRAVHFDALVLVVVCICKRRFQE